MADDEQETTTTPVSAPLRGEYPSAHECPNDCGAQLVYFAEDRLYYCRRCAEEFTSADVEK